MLISGASMWAMRMGRKMPDFTPIVRLDEEKHIYTVQTVEDGPFTVKASVTTILETLVYVERFDVYVDTLTGKDIAGEYVRQAGDFGRAFHKGANFIVHGKEIKEPPELKQAFGQLRGWMIKEEAYPTVASEMRVYCPKLDVCGTLDWMGKLKRNNVLNLVDWKTSKYNPMVGPQTFAYMEGYRAMTGYQGIIKRWAWIYDKSKGSYKFVELSDNIGDRDMFGSMNYQFRWRRK